MEYNLETNVPNIHANYHPALYKGFVFIEENVRNLTIGRTKLLCLMLTTQIYNVSHCFENIKFQNSPNN